MNEAARMVWNRACQKAAATNLRPGDRALRAMLLAHGLVMNGGVLHACEALEEAELDAACAGYRHFGFWKVATLLTKGYSVVAADDDDDDLESRFDEAYWASIPSDDVLCDAFERDFETRMDEYAPPTRTP
jgi:hypothetical protein